MRPAAVANTISIRLSPSRSAICGGGSPPPSIRPSPLASIAIGQPRCVVGSWWTKKTLRSSPTLVASSPSVTRRRRVNANWFDGTFAWPCTTTPDGGAEKFVPGGKAAMTSARNFSDRKSTRLNSSHVRISYAVFCLKKKKKLYHNDVCHPRRHRENQQEDRRV